MAVGAIANATEAEFDKYMPHFRPFLSLGLSNYEEHQVCQVAVGVVGDICRALEGRLLPYCDEILGNPNPNPNPDPNPNPTPNPEPEPDAEPNPDQGCCSRTCRARSSTATSSRPYSRASATSRSPSAATLKSTWT